MKNEKILFYVSNGVGFGHLRRVQLAAEELKKKEKVEVALATSSLSPQIFGKFFDYLVKLEPLTEKLDNDEAVYLRARAKNEQRLLAVVKKFQPDLIVADFHLSQSRFVFHPLQKVLDAYPTKTVFIWRLDSLKTFLSDREKLKDKLKYFDKIILPHSPLELPGFEPGHKFKLVGPIVKRIDRNRLSDCRRKYNLSPRDFVLTVAFGAGGEMKGYCDSPIEAIKNFLVIYPELKKRISHLKTILITGFYLKEPPKKKIPGLKIVAFEKNLPELIKLSALVVAAAGYNTGNEIVAAQTPAVLIPLKRSGGEQVERAEFFEKMGVAERVKGLTPEELLDKILFARRRLKEMKNNFKNFSDWGGGNKKAAEIILTALAENGILKKDLDDNPYLPADLSFFDTKVAKLKINRQKYIARPVFSVVIPTFNKKKSLKMVLNSFFNQDYPVSKYEVVVVDDGSSDGTLESIRKIKPKCNFRYFYWPRKKLAMKKEFRGWAKFYNRAGLARNIGLSAARGEIILFNDADILAGEDCLKRHQKYHRKYPNIVVRGFKMLLSKGAGIDSKKTARPEKPADEKILHCRMHDLTQEGWHRVVTSNLSIRKKYLEKIGGFSRDYVFWGFEDADLGYRLSRKLKLKFIWDADIKVYHLWHPREAGGERQYFLAFKIGANIMYNKYRDKEIVSVFNEAASRRFKKYL